MARRRQALPSSLYRTETQEGRCACPPVPVESQAATSSRPPRSWMPWPGPVVDYLHGTIDAATLIEIAKKSQEAHDLSQVCEAHFYMAEDALLRQRGDAVALFRQTAKECPPNFHEYEVLRMNAAPKAIHVHMVPGDYDAPLGGVGEPGVPPIAPALCNAIFAATGRRIRRLPIKGQLTA